MHDAMHTLQNPTEEHQMLRQMVRTFANDVVEPQAEEYNRRGEFNRELFRKCGELGLLGITVPAEAGGGGLDVLASVLVHHELAKSDPGFTLAYLAHAVLFVNNFFFAASDEQRNRLLPKTLTGEHVGCMCMTEPEAGTDVLGMKTTARRDGDFWVLNGSKSLITNAPEADLFLVYAKIDGRSPRSWWSAPPLACPCRPRPTSSACGRARSARWCSRIAACQHEICWASPAAGSPT
jgi:isovaleryl-CoA dehydrogenase